MPNNGIKRWNNERRVPLNMPEVVKSNKNIMYEKISQLENELEKMPKPPTFTSKNLKDTSKKSAYLAAMKEWRGKRGKLLAQLQQLKNNLQKAYEWDVNAHEGRAQ